MNYVKAEELVSIKSNSLLITREADWRLIDFFYFISDAMSLQAVDNHCSPRVLLLNYLRMTIFLGNDIGVVSRGVLHGLKFKMFIFLD